MINEKARARFKYIVSEKIHREGISDLMEWLENHTDFYTAPASAKYHNNFEGGLLEHSLNVYDQLTGSEYRNEFPSDESVAIVALFHDLCKVNFYKISMRNNKNEQTGQWEKVPYYDYNNEQFIYGHGEKSVYLIMKYMKLTDEEAQAINAHMSGFDKREHITDCYNTNILALELAIADMRATFIDEVIK